MTDPGPRRALFAAGTVAMVLAVLALGRLPRPPQVERGAAAAPSSPRLRVTTTTVRPATVAPGRHEVGGAGVRPGVYVTSGDLCTWDGLGPGGQVLASDAGSGQALVEARATDAGFSSSPGCGTRRAFEGDDDPLSSFGPGTFAVGPQVAPGHRRADGGDLWYWMRLSGLGGSMYEPVASARVPGPTEVVVAPTDAAFRSSGCGTWRTAG